jgi:formylglycine-generating enzyme required for sulfatase activity
MSNRANCLGYGTARCSTEDSNAGSRATAPIAPFAPGVLPLGLDDTPGDVSDWSPSEFPGRVRHLAMPRRAPGDSPHSLRGSSRHVNPLDIGLDMVGFRCTRRHDRSQDIDRGDTL